MLNLEGDLREFVIVAAKALVERPQKLDISDGLSGGGGVVPSRRDRAVVENRKILSFKKIRNRLINRKITMENRFMKSIR